MSFEAISSFTSVYTAWQTATARTHSGDAFPPTSDELIESLTVLCNSLHTVVASKQPTTPAKKSKSRKGKKALAAAATRGAMFKDFGLPTKNQVRSNGAP